MLETLVIVLVVLWLIGGIALPAVGGLLNILVALAIIMIVVRLIRGEKI
jgi:hypothetical protein